MINIERYPSRNSWNNIIQRANADDKSIKKAVRKILKSVRKDGDKALHEYTLKFDGTRIKKFLVDEGAIFDAANSIDQDLKKAILHAKGNLTAFHELQKETGKKIEIANGVTCWRFSSAIQKVGLYIPGGNAPLFSTILMLGIPAVLAGCRDIILCTPPGKFGNIHPAILFTAHICGISKIFKIGGAQAIGAMAYGTNSIPKVDKIFGPGNQYVTCAKQLVQQEGISIDMPAGPSELMIVSDNTGVASYIAADLLSQAEHGPDSQVIFATDNERFAMNVAEEITIQVPGLSRLKIIKEALKNSRIVVLKTLDECMQLANEYAPEHLILAGNSASGLLSSVHTAGSVFIGNYSSESAGDYATGTNHTLPTNGHARAYSGVSVDSFVKKITVQEVTREGLQSIGSTVMTMAAAEGLDAHKNAISIRLKNMK